MSNFWKDLFRTIRNSLGRFLAIGGICALGVGFFGGLQMTCGSMKLALNDFYNQTNMMDIRIISDLGISEENVNAFREVDGVSSIMPSRETDILTNFGNEQCSVRVHSLPDNLDINNKDYINQQVLEEGSWPQNDDECVLGADVILSEPPKIGDEIELLECSTNIEDTVDVKKLKIVGFVHSSYYAATVQMGSSVLGKGSVSQFAYVKDSFFKDSFPYSEVFITVDQARKYVTGSDDYQNVIEGVITRLSGMVPQQAQMRTSSVKDEAQKKLDDAYKTIVDSEKELNDNYALFYSSKDSTMSTIENAIATINSTISNVSNLKDQCNSNMYALEQANALVNNYDTVMQGLSQIIIEANKALELNGALASIIDDPAVKEQIEQMNVPVNYLITCANGFYEAMQVYPLPETYLSLIDAYNEIFGGVCLAMPAQQIICDSVIANCQTILNEQILPNKQKAIAEFNKNEQKLIDGKNQLDEAKAKLRDSQKEVDDIDKANFYVMDRTKNLGAVSYDNDAKRIANIANVFPLMFFFVALLIVLTSMTRMIEEERVAIGTYKALGFSKYIISFKYILYGVFASVLGSVIGLAILCQFLPYVIAVSYNTVYDVPIILPMPFNWIIGAISIIIGVGVTVIAILMAAVKSLKLSPANLMIPSAPKAGKRILLEHIRPFWKVLNFNWKISLRNMFLYKKRLFMTLVGIAGCTALLLTAFGLHDSIGDIMNKQFGEIAFDNFKIVFEDDANETQQLQTFSTAKDVEQGFAYSLVHEENVLCLPEGHTNAATTIVVPKDPNQFQDLRVMRNRESQEYYTIDNQGVYVSEKLAILMNVSIGDTISVYNQDLIGNAGSEMHEFYIAGIVENYIANYIYMNSSVFENSYKEPPIYSAAFGKSQLEEQNQQTLIDNIKKNTCVKSAYFTTNARQTYERSIKTVDMVVYVLLAAAALLAFVVLYNLININLCERLRELATLKVLGSNRREINMYIHRETFMLSAIGSILGLLFGTILENFVSASAEVDYVMFGKTIYMPSYVFSFGITMLFTILVVIFMRKKLFSISMVESLKSVE